MGQSSPSEALHRDQCCPLLFTDGQGSEHDLVPECVADIPCAGAISHFSHALNFSCYLYSKGNPCVNGKFGPSVNSGCNA